MARKKKGPQGVKGAQLNRARQYLGLRPVVEDDGRRGTGTGTGTGNEGGADVHPSVVFVAIDVEAYERDHSKITEVGIATLDTRHLRGISPGDDHGGRWWDVIRSRHFRIKENAHLVNREFVSGCEDRFEFGQSEWISVVDAATILAQSCGPDPARNIVLVGLAIEGDLAHLRKLNFDVRQSLRVIDSLDVGIIDREARHLSQSRNLGNIIYDQGIKGWNLHNAGNDAVYTLQATLALAVRDDPSPDQPASPLKVRANEDLLYEDDDDDEDRVMEARVGTIMLP